MNGLRLITYGLAAVLLLGCGQQAPQRPSQRRGQAPKADSAQLALMEMNRRLTEAADEQVMRWAQAQEEPFALYAAGTWVHMINPGDAERPVVHDEECTVRMRIFHPKGTLYSDTQQTARAGKYEFPAAIDENITEWHHGAQLRLAAPWYAAYGIKGTDRIPPYQNVIIELDIR